MMQTSRALRPLPVHLAHAQACWGGAVPGLAAVLMQQNGAALHPDLRAECASLMGEAATLPRENLLRDIARSAQARLADLLSGIENYLNHPYAPSYTPAKTIWQQGSTRLLDYGATTDDAPSVLMVPSLINPYTVLDLMPGRSLVAEVRKWGLRPLVLDWQAPGPQECRFDIGDYITKRLVPALQFVRSETSQPVHVFGYCMGGLLSVAAASLAPELLQSLTLLATPWDFQVEGGPVGQNSFFVSSGGESLLAENNDQPLTGDMVQMLFVSRDTAQNDRKFRRFAHVDPAAEEAHFFVALEAWANGCAALSRPAAKACVADWYRANKPARGLWEVDGQLIDPAAMNVRTLVIAPARDTLVPPGSAAPLVAALQAAGGDAVYDSPPGGHVGLLVGSARQQHLWPRLSQWWGR